MSALDWRDIFKRYRDAREGGYVEYEELFTEAERAAIEDVDRECREEANGMTDEQVQKAFHLDCPVCPAIPTTWCIRGYGDEFLGRGVRLHAERRALV